MGIDIHIHDHYFSFHVPHAAIFLLAALAVYAVFKLARYVLAAKGGAL